MAHDPRPLGARQIWMLVPAALAWTIPCLAQNYGLTDLGAAVRVTNPDAVIARALNDEGTVVGGMPVGNGSHAFLLAGNDVIDLGTLGGETSSAYAISNSSLIVGQSATSTGGVPRGFLWQGGNMTDLLTLAGGISSVGLSVNDAGQIVGTSQVIEGQQQNLRAFLWEDGTLQELETLGGPEAQASDINGVGHIVGWSENADGERRAVLWSNGQVTDLGTLGGNFSEATAINETGQVVGWARTALGQLHAFRYADSTMTDLGTLGGTNSKAIDINDAGTIVGSSQTQGNFIEHAFVLEPTATAPRDLNDTVPTANEWLLSAALAVNNSDQILATGTRSSASRPFLLTPAASDADGDGIEFAMDNCPDDANPQQEDADGDGVGDACDGCPDDAVKQAPGACGCGNPETDVDEDDVIDCIDNCPVVANADQADDDEDGIGNACEDGGGEDGSTCGLGLVGLLAPLWLGLTALRRTRRFRPN